MFVEEQDEVLSDEERQCRNSVIIAELTLEKAKDSLNSFNIADLKFYRLERVQFNKELKARR